jgi:hypothetical protein
VVAKSSRLLVIKHGDRDWWACLRASGIRRRLADDESGQGVRGHFRMAGRFLAYEREDDCYARCMRMVSLDVSSGRRLVSYAAYAYDAVPLLRRVVLDARGRLTWIRDDTVRELHRMDSDGEEVIDTGRGIAPASLAINGGQVLWRKDGGAKSARLDSHPPCALRNSSTLERTPEVRVFWKEMPSKDGFGDGAVYGCDLASGRVTLMGDRQLVTFEYYGGGFVHAAGHFATIDEGFAGRGDGMADLSVFDLTSGERVHRWNPSGDFNVDAVVLHPSGAVAWMYRGAPYGSDKYSFAVAKSDAAGEAVALASSDTSDAADRESLRLNGDVVSWTLGGTPGSAELR